MKQVIFGESGNLAKHIIRAFPGIEVYSRKGNNIFDLDRPEDLIDRKIENSIVYFTAAVSSPEKCATEYEKCWRLNVENSIKIMRRLLEKGNKVVFFSSDAVYGETREIVTEDSIPSPDSAYGEMKYAVERSLREFEKFYVLRLSYIYTGDDSFSRYVCDVENVALYTGFYRSVAHFSLLKKVLGDLHVGKINHAITNIVGPRCISRVELFHEICKAKKISKKYQIQSAPEDFFSFRPEIINCASKYIQPKGIADC